MVDVRRALFVAERSPCRALLVLLLMRGTEVRKLPENVGESRQFRTLDTDTGYRIANNARARRI